MFRSGLSVFLGFVLMAILVKSYQMVLWMTMPDIFPTPEQIESGDILLMPIGINVLMIVVDTLIGAFVGYFAIAIAGGSRIGHALSLAVLVIAMSLLSLSQSLALETVGYVWFRFLLVPICVVAGGLVRCKQQPPSGETEATS
jgi:hypothetical protein